MTIQVYLYNQLDLCVEFMWMDGIVSLCKFSCEESAPNRCDVAMLELSTADVPKKFRKAGLPAYEGTDENGKTIETFGYGTTGVAEELSTADECSDAEPDGKSTRNRVTFPSPHTSDTWPISPLKT